MLTIKKMTEAMRDEVLPMVLAFYHSDAVCHAVPEETLRRTFNDAVSDDPVLEGFVLVEDGVIIGFAYTTTFYACEVGGRCMMIEEIFLKEEARGKGYGTEFFNRLFSQHPEITRFRLEATEENQAAIALYKRLGFDFLDYLQLVRE